MVVEAAAVDQVSWANQCWMKAVFERNKQMDANNQTTSTDVQCW